MDHPKQEIQDIYSIGDILAVELDRQNKKAYQYTLIRDQSIQKAIEDHRIAYGSPSVTGYSHDTVIDRQGRMTFNRWWANHDAIVKKPAYGPKDRIVGICEGDLAECRIEMVNMKADLNDSATEQLTITPFVRKMVEKRFKGCSISKKGGIDTFLGGLDSEKMEKIAESALISYVSQELFKK